MSDVCRELIEAFRHAVDGEKRFGHRGDTDIVAELNNRWMAAIELIEKLCRKTPQKK